MFGCVCLTPVEFEQQKTTLALLIEMQNFQYVLAQGSHGLSASLLRLHKLQESVIH